MRTPATKPPFASGRLFSSSDEAFETLVDSSPLALVGADPDGKIVLWNRAAEELFGWSREEVIGQFNPTVGEERSEEYRGLRKRALEAGFRDFETLRRRKDGTSVLVRIDGFPLRSTSGALIGVAAFLTDVSQQKRASELLEVRLAQQAIVARLGQIALGDPDLDEFLQRAVDELCNGLNVELGGVAELTESSGDLIVRVISSASDQDALPIRIDAELAREVLESEVPIVRETAEGTRSFLDAPSLVEWGVVGGIAVRIRVEGMSWGALAAVSKESRRFSEDDDFFISAVANVVSESIGRRRVMQRLIDSESRLSLLISQLPAIFWSVDSDLRIMSLHGSGLVSMGLEANQYLGGTLESLLPHGHQAREAASKALQGERSIYEHPYESRILRTVVEPLRVADGKIAGAVALALDVTEQLHAVEAIRESEERFRTMANQAPVGIWTTDESGACTFANDWWLSITGQSMENCLGLGWTKQVRFRDVDRILDGYNRALASQDAYRHEYELRVNDGSFRWVVGTGIPRFSAQGSFLGYVGSTVDVTEERHNLEKTEQSREQLRALSSRLLELQEKERIFISREIHDLLGQVLTALKLDATWIEHHVHDAETAPIVGRMSALIDDTIREVRSFASELRPRVLDDFGLVPAVEDYVTEFEKRTGIECELSIRPESLEADGDRSTALFRILQEALTNVTRHAGATRVDIRLRRRKGLLRLEVRDNGRGIRHEQSENPASLGILGIRERVHPWEGTARFAGTPGKGTIVAIGIPIEP